MTTSPRRFAGKLLSGAVLITALFASAPAASAAPGREQVTMRFEFNRTAPADVTYASLRRAAVRTCNMQGGTILTRATQACAADLIKAAVVKIGDVHIARLHAERTGQSMPMLAMAQN